MFGSLYMYNARDTVKQRAEASDDPRTLAWPPYHPWLRVRAGPLPVRADKKLTYNTILPDRYLLYSVSYLSQLNKVSTQLLVRVVPINYLPCPPHTTRAPPSRALLFLGEYL